MSLSTTIKSIQKIMRQDSGLDGDAQRIGQLGWMLFLKIFSDFELETELEDDGYKSPIPLRFRWGQWADGNLLGKDALTGEELISFVNNDLFPNLKALDLSLYSGQARERGKLLVSVFSDAYNYMKKGTLLRQVVNKLNQDIDYNSAETRHLFGDIYEQILRDLQNAGNAGEYYTPRAVTNFAIEMLDPQLGDVVLDPACGTGGFLTAAFEHMKKQVRNPDELRLLKRSIRGVEKKPLPHVLCATNMMVHGIEVPSNIVNGNTLARPLRDYGRDDQVDVIITNPPFGGVEEDGVENNFPGEFRTRETADLFLVLVMELLKDGGSAAVVLPDGTLFGEGVKTKIKKKMLEECNLHTIVRLPKSVFSPYTDIATNVLFLTKGEPTKEIWYFEHPLPEGVKAYSKTKPMRADEFTLEKSWWHNRAESQHSWRVSASEVERNNYNLDIANPNRPPAQHGEPTELFEKHLSKKSAVAHLVDSLRGKLLPVVTDTNRVAELLENLEVILDSPSGVARLKSIILNLAFSGHFLRDVTASLSQWERASLDQVCEYIQRGKSPRYADRGSCLVISQKSVHWSGLRLESARFIEDSTLDAYKAERFLRDGDLLWNSTGTGTVGRTAVFRLPEPSSKYVADSHVTVLRPTKIDSGFLSYWSRTPSVQKAVLGSTTGSTNQQELNLSTLKKLEISFPPLEHQTLLTRHLDDLMALCETLEARILESRELGDLYSVSLAANLT